MNQRTQPFALLLVLFSVLDWPLFRAVIRAFALRTFFHLAPLLHVLHLLVSIVIPTIFFKTIIAMARAVVLFSRFLMEPLQCAKCSIFVFLRVCFERLFAKWAPHHSRTTLNSISVHGAGKQQILPALLRCESFLRVY